MALPEWFRRIPPVDRSVLSATNNGLTIKRCMPFLDAMTLGCILPIGATVRLQISEQGRKVDAGWEFDRVMVSNHGSYQIAGHPLADRPPEVSQLLDDQDATWLELSVRGAAQSTEPASRNPRRRRRHRQLRVVDQLPVHCDRF